MSGCDAAVGVGGTPAVDKGALQTDIANRLAKAGEQPQLVTCNEDMLSDVGKTARCEVVMSLMNSFEPVITVTGVDGGTVNYAMTPALSKQQLEEAVSRLVAEASRAQVASVSCESGLDGNGLLMNFEVVPVLTRAEVASSLLDGYHRFGHRVVHP